MGRVYAMNEIITKLNEIEEKAQTILCDARASKEEMMAKLDQDKREIDAEYDRLETESMQQLKARLRADAEAEIAKLRQKNKQAAEEFDIEFAKEKERLAEQILASVTQ